MKLILTTLLMLMSVETFAAQKKGIGKIIRISTSFNGSEASRTIDIEGFGNSGTNCYQSGATQVMSILFENNHGGDSQYSLALAAYLADKKVRVKVDDTYMTGVLCQVRTIQMCKSDDICI